MTTTMRSIVKTSRPRFWLYLAGPVLVGLVFGASTVDELTSPQAISVFLYFLIPANVLLYGVNDVFDAEIDRLNPKKSRKERRFEGNTSILLAVVASAILGIVPIVVVPRSAAPWFLGFFVLAVAYSIPPIQLKRRPILDSLSNGLYILPGIGAYSALTGAIPPIEIITGAWLWTMAMHTFSAIPDIGPDRQGGIRTTATVLGRQGSLVYCAILWSLAAVSFALIDARAGVLLAIYPMTIIGVTQTSISVDRAYWLYPAINAVVGMIFTLYGLWELLYV